jgi:hypothetical protein
MCAFFHYAGREKKWRNVAIDTCNAIRKTLILYPVLKIDFPERWEIDRWKSPIDF